MTDMVQNNRIDSNIQNTQRSFQMAANAHTFEIMTTKLYSNPKKAVIREISCNAHDAHVMSGQATRPIVVKLPTFDDPTFYVQDFGPGLAEEQIYDHYIVVGESGKKAGEGQTGRYGLGCKSPYAYTTLRDSSAGFTVTSVQDGFMKVYSCYRDEHRIPACVKMAEMPTPDANWTHGIRVSMSVHKQDIEEFQRVAIEVFKWFDVYPEIIGLDSLKNYNRMDDEKGTICGPIVYHPDAVGFGIAMGGILYPVDLNSSELKSAMTEMELAVLKVPGYNRAPLESVQMAPSREQLLYIPLTVNYIKKIAEDAVESIVSEIKTVCESNESERSLKWCADVYQLLKDKLAIFKFSHSMYVNLLQRSLMDDPDLFKKVNSIYFGKTMEAPDEFGAVVAGVEAKDSVVYSVVYPTPGKSTLTRYDITNGHYRSKKQDGSRNRYNFDLSSKFAIIAIDEPYAKEKLKIYFERTATRKYDTFIQVSMNGYSAEKKTKVIAQAIALGNSVTFRGIPVIKLSELGVSYTPTKANRAERTDAALPSGDRTWLERFGAETFAEVWSVSAGEIRKDRTQSLATIVGAQVPVYYVLHDLTGWRGYRNPYEVDPQDMKAVITEGTVPRVQTEGNDGDEAFRDLLGMMYAMTGVGFKVVCLKGQSAVRRMKLKDNGISAFFVEFYRQLVNPEMAQTVCAKMVQRLRADFKDLTIQPENYFSNMGIVGGFLFSYIKKPELWNALSQTDNTLVLGLITRVQELAAACGIVQSINEQTGEVDVVVQPNPQAIEGLAYHKALGRFNLNALPALRTLYQAAMSDTAVQNDAEQLFNSIKASFQAFDEVEKICMPRTYYSGSNVGVFNMNPIIASKVILAAFEGHAQVQAQIMGVAQAQAD